MHTECTLASLTSLSLIIFSKVDLAMDVEKALPRKIRKRLMPEREVVQPNQYSGFKRFWFSPPISAEDIQTALKPKKVSVVAFGLPYCLLLPCGVCWRCCLALFKIHKLTPEKSRRQHLG